ncbi:alpha/beta hydrolase [Streptomyces sp. DG2A-72]|uniref:alpha/beta hydrolase n=1 Tax=Streptomyces sp. DG2A-72 TaxID=3051386 RepID=UPI00265BFDB6|nr:alpha/beta hydrolase [Streptomyces sp. DG2A-72]MDO0930746.1 alpha/beta hydrolase [Streptomyces sp. DG2A-72]
MLAKLTTRLKLRRSTLTGAVGLAVLAAGLPAVAVRDTESDLTRFYRQKVVWTKCDSKSMPKDLQCGKVTVPLDYAKPKSGTLELALARYRATGKSRGSVVLNFGGPGIPGIPELAFGGDDFMELTDGYDVVSFDPRGVGRSSPVSCGDGSDEASEAMGTGTDLTDDPRAVLKQLKEAAAQCAKHSGPVLPNIGTVNASRDLDVIRQAVGDKKLNYLGFSYGTRLGAVYAAQFPDKVGRLVLDGVDTLTEPLTEQAVVGAEGQQTALDAFVAWCAEDDVACPLGTDSRTAREHVVTLVDSLDEDPVPTDFGDSFTGQDLVAALSQALYSENMWPTLERAIASLVEDGDARGLLALTGGGMARDDDGALADEEDVPFDNLPAALMAINCADDPDRPTADWITKNLDRLRTEYEEASPVFGEYRLTEVLMCYGRPKGTDYIRKKVRDVDTPKMLLVGTRGDPATPYWWTTETAKRLGSSAVVLDNRGEGHTGYASSKCVHKKVDDFLLYGSLPASGSSCGSDDDD